MFESLMGRMAPRFAWEEPRRRARGFVLGLLSHLPRKNCWTLAEHAGNATPNGLQHLLSRARWDADAVRDDLRGFVIEHPQDDKAVLATALEAGVNEYTAELADERDDKGRCLVASNGYHHPR